MNRLWSKATGWSSGAADSDGTATAADSRTSSFPSSSSSTSPSSLASSSSPSSSSWTYWDYANSTMSNAAEATYSLFPSVPPLSWPLFGTTASTTTTIDNSSSTSMEKTTYRPPSSLLGLWADRIVTKKAEHTASSGGSSSFRRLIRTGSGSGGGNSSYNNNMSWMRNNPYNSVRGRHGGYRQSMYAVRSFLTVAPVESNNDVNDNNNWQQHQQPKIIPEKETGNANDDKTLAAVSHALMSDESLLDTTSTKADDGGGGGSSAHLHRERSRGSSSTGSLTQQSPPLLSSKSKQNSLTACHVAEGTIRALRDLLLDEAVELNAALRFWSDRWERPLVSWLEAGPIVWASSQGYNHRLVGNQVAQIQAVLARRCAAIGELQEHLLRAGWQRGVAQWGVLGQGGQWAAVAPGIIDGSMVGDVQSSPSSYSPSRKAVTGSIPLQHQEQIIGGGDRRALMDDESESRYDFDDAMPLDGSQMSVSDARRAPQAAPLSSPRAANVVVRKRDGGGIFVDDPSFLVKWSVEAILLVRKQLHRAGNGLIAIPYGTNWIDTSTVATAIASKEAHDDGEVVIAPADPGHGLLPLWACEALGQDRARAESLDENIPKTSGENGSTQLAITDLPLMMEEVSELLNIMEEVVLVQRHRRLERLRPPAWWRRNWFTLVTGVPLCAWLVYKGYTTDLIRQGIRQVKIFFRERLREPLIAIFEHIWKGRDSFADEAIRVEVITVLKKMIKAWLDENCPNMPESQRYAMAEAMDVSLIERKKEESMKTFYEINNVIRMSFIEMEYMKKEMMNALKAMDEVISANDINMNIAAITPVVMLGYVNSKIFRYLSYAVLKLGKSREETYASLRNVLTDMERLLVMRDNPPSGHHPQPGAPSSNESNCVLGPDDLGMIMLLIHECRTILWTDHRRFTTAMVQGITEDLAELAGERGAVSVRQQLQIISRMTRTYPFLKVISTGHLYQYSPLRLE